MRTRSGRRNRYSRASAKVICARIAMGETLLSICADEDMPGRSTVYRWLEKDEKFAIEYMESRKFQANSIAESVVEIADTVQLGKDELAKAKLRIDARKWFVGKMTSNHSGQMHDPLSPEDNADNIPRVTVRIASGVDATKD